MNLLMPSFTFPLGAVAENFESKAKTALAMGLGFENNFRAERAPSGTAFGGFNLGQNGGFGFYYIVYGDISAHLNNSKYWYDSSTGYLYRLGWGSWYAPNSTNISQHYDYYWDGDDSTVVADGANYNRRNFQPMISGGITYLPMWSQTSRTLEIRRRNERASSCRLILSRPA